MVIINFSLNKKKLNITCYYIILQNVQNINLNLMKNKNRNLETYMNFTMKSLINLHDFPEKESIFKNICMVGDSFIKQHYQIRKFFIVL